MESGLPKTVFWSWQSDRPHRETRGIIREALAEAITQLAAEVSDADRPDDSGLALDHDTKGLGGSPDIAAAILDKIEAAAVFVADVTPIALSASEGGKRVKHVANPNVLIELGFAKKALGPDRIVQVWNTGFTSCTPDDLPFDMRGRRGPISFSLMPGASTEELRKVRESLVAQLKGAIDIILRQSSSREVAPLRWKPNRENDPSVWFDKDTKFVVNEPFHGSGRIWLTEGATRFVRMLPARWEKARFAAAHAAMLGHTSGYSWGRTTGGLLTYSGSILRPELAEGTQATMWFLDTGEVWAVDRWIVNEWRGRKTAYGDEFIKGLKAFVQAQLPLLTGNGGGFPVHIRVGVSGMSGSFWPVANPAFSPPEALEDNFEHEFVISAADDRTLNSGLVDAWSKYREMFGLGPPDAEDIREALEA